jgi:Flp pilus assembly pilin Flp
MVNVVTSAIVRAQNAFHNLREQEDGQGFVEYITMVALIALGLFVAIIVFRDELGTIFSKITDKIEANIP